MEHHPSGARSRRATHARAESRPRRAVARALAALLVAGAALPGLVVPDRADADPTLEPPGGGTVPVTSSAGRLGATTINVSATDRTTNVPDNAYVGTVRGAGPYDPADPAQSSAPLQPGTAQPMLDAAVASGDYWTYIARGLPGARDRDNRMSNARRRVAWDEMFDLALDPVKARSYFESAPPSTDGTCTMCGEMCAMRTVNTIMGGLTVDLGKE